MKMTHHHRTQILSPAASRRRTSRTAYVPCLDCLEGRIALNATVSFINHQLKVVADYNTSYIKVHAVKPAGAAQGQISVSYDDHGKPFSRQIFTDKLESVVVQTPRFDTNVSLDFKGFSPSTSVQEGPTNPFPHTAPQVASVSQSMSLSFIGLLED